MNGLTKNEVIKNRRLYGSNVIKKISKESFIHKLIATLGDPIIRILLIALAIKTLFLFQSFDWYETIGILIAIFLASFISTISEYGSERAFERLQEDASKIKVKVKRDGVTQEVTIDEVVVGDVVLLSTGDSIPADGKIISGSILINESSLNGEMIEKEKKQGEVVYRSSIIYSGMAVMVVDKVGDDTFYGKIAQEVLEKSPTSPLKLRLLELSKLISKIGYVGALFVSLSYLFSVIFINNHFDGELILKTISNFPLMFGHFLHALTLSVTIIVVAVPEGLPLMVTLVLSSNMKRMLKSNVLVRRLMGIETAGNINMLFTDKTGTITKGKLNVVAISDGGGNLFRDEEELKRKLIYYKRVKLSLTANNEAVYDVNGAAVGGNITDRSLLKFFKNDKVDYDIIDRKPFSSDNKYSLTTVRYKNKIINLIKGAPEVIIDKCTHFYISDEKRILVNKKRIYKQISEATKKGIRVLAFATAPDGKKLERFSLVGLVYIKDEVRPEAAKGLELINKAHIKTVMITGDNIETAKAIGYEVGLLKESTDIVLTSEEFNQKSDDEIRRILPNLKILARLLPQDKSRLVRIAQESGLVVGMTGDGVNDAPALKKADVGFAMGSGTEVAKEASDVVILDNNLFSISKAILYGRTIFKSIRKFIIFQLTMNICAVSISILGPFIGKNMPITVIQMLWINMVMDTLAGIAFSFEPPLLEYMNEVPKTKGENIINRYMKDEIIFTGSFSACMCLFFLKSSFIHNMFRQSADDRYLMTAFFGLFIFMGIFNSFNARTHRLNLFANLSKNKVFLVVILFIVLTQVYLLYFGGDLFRAYGLNVFEFEVMLLLALCVVPVDWIRKLYLRKCGEIGGV
ncbi:MAG: calcium-translocating P-type ATPase, PMCA-type [Bacilli bacterium]|nr:calcium-translocating P-type ATPase, PMCA-type [Bacilli bacterium]